MVYIFKFLSFSCKLFLYSPFISWTFLMVLSSIFCEFLVVVLWLLFLILIIHLLPVFLNLLQYKFVPPSFLVFAIHKFRVLSPPFTSFRLKFVLHFFLFLPLVFILIFYIKFQLIIIKLRILFE